MNGLIFETRVAVLARMVNGSPNRTLGRTQLMKLLYFLQELKGVPLGYDFKLFTYGPFDSEVLSDLSSACGQSAVIETTIQYPRGYGYNITPASNADNLSQELKRNQAEVAAKTDEVVHEFGSHGATELELRSTILYVDREAGQSSSTFTEEALADRVHKIKPHFSKEMILGRIGEMKAVNFLENISKN